jgi:hypothetical protein
MGQPEPTLVKRDPVPDTSGRSRRPADVDCQRPDDPAVAELGEDP